MIGIDGLTPLDRDLRSRFHDTAGRNLEVVVGGAAEARARSLQQNEKPRHEAGARKATAYIRP